VPIRAGFTVQGDALAKMRSALEAADEHVRVRDLSLDDGDLEGTVAVIAENADEAKELAERAIEASLPHGPGAQWEIGDPPEWAEG
jgi:hypothetical protein